jgi:hypothetical protein
VSRGIREPASRLGAGALSRSANVAHEPAFTVNPLKREG